MTDEGFLRQVVCEGVRADEVARQLAAWCSQLSVILVGRSVADEQCDPPSTVGRRGRQAVERTLAAGLALATFANVAYAKFLADLLDIGCAALVDEG
jgi:hypothetical protein